MEHFVGRADELAVLDAATAALRAGQPRVVLVEGAPGRASQVSPVLVFAIMFGLSMDYEVFLVSRIRERYDATGGHRAAIASGLQRTGGVITSAALLLIIVVGAFSASSITIIKLIGVSMIVALVLAATLVRVLLVPATMRRFGTASWWAPVPLRRLYARYGIREDGGLDPEIAAEPVTQPAAT